MSIGLLGQKIGMTSVYDAKGRLRPVTVIAAGDNVLLRRLTEQNDGYSGVQVGFGVQKESRVTKPLLGEFKKAGVGPQKFVREFRLTNDLPEGEINLSVTQFQAGDYDDVIGRSKGERISRRDEEAQLPRTRCGTRFENASARWCGGQSFYSGAYLEKHGNAWSSG